MSQRPPTIFKVEQGRADVASHVVNERNILGVVRPLLDAAKTRIWVTAPWVTTSAADLFFGSILERLRGGENLDVRVVYRLKGADDLTISDLDALDRLEAAGCQVRYSNRLHAKVVLVDDNDAVVSSSNLTSTAGYSMNSGAWQNEELGVHLSAEPALIAELVSEFEQIWSDAHELSDRTVGITLDQTTSATVRVACMRPPVVGEFVSVGMPPRTVGQVISVSSYNPTVPAEAGDTDAILGLRGGGGGRRSTVPDVQTLFSHPSKTHAFLMAQTFVKSAATYHVADVAVLRSVGPDGHFAPSVTAVDPGEIVTEAAPALLDELISGQAANRLEIGHLPANPTVRVTLDRDRFLTLHAAVLGMTGAGKSNAVKVLLSRLLAEHPDLRIVMVDTHGEYGGIGGVNERRLRVRFEPCLVDERWVKRASRAGRALNETMDAVHAALDQVGTEAALTDVADAIEAEASGTGKTAEAIRRLAEAVRQTPNLSLTEEDSTIVEMEAAPTHVSVDWSTPGVYRLDLVDSDSYADRISQTGAVADSVLAHAKATRGQQPILLVVDESQNYAPEQQTGRLSMARRSFEPLFEIATEGRKFHCGLLVASQRPARLNKDILSQCNTQLIFRMVSVEDLDAVRDCFEGASLDLLAALPGYETGTCYAGGVALSMGVQVAVPLAQDRTDE
jgi:DNA helicase HerA-like ATPase